MATSFANGKAEMKGVADPTCQSNTLAHVPATRLCRASLPQAPVAVGFVVVGGGCVERGIGSSTHTMKRSNARTHTHIKQIIVRTHTARTVAGSKQPRTQRMQALRLRLTRWLCGRMHFKFTSL